MSRRLHRDEYTVGWICALDIELVAAQEMLDEEYHPPLISAHESNIYTCGRIGEHLVVIACLPEGRMGTTSAATVANQIRMTFTSVRFGLMVGIGGGVPSDTDVRLGDVVVSKPHNVHGGVVQYDFGKATSSGFKRTGSLDGPPTVLLNAVVNLKAKLMRRRGKLFQCLDKFADLPDFTREAAGEDILFQPEYEHIGGTTCNNCDREQAIVRGTRTRDLMVHYGTIASGNEVMKKAAIRDQLSAELGGVLCFEMEAAGLMNNFPCLVIRGISDYADSHKNDRWQPYAAATAAAYAKELLNVVPAIEVKNSRTAKEVTEKPDGHTPLGSSTGESLAGEEIRLGNQNTITAAARECLQSLAFPEQEQRFLNVHTAQNTCQWLLDDKQYQDWVHSPRGFFWIKGHPGTGKSVLTKFAVTSYRKSNPNEIVATFFIHGQGISLQHTVHGLLRALLNSLLLDFPQHLSELTKVFKSRNEQRGNYNQGKWEWATSELQETLTRVLRDGTTSQPATLFIDALDECGEEAARSLLVYFETQTKCETAQVKVCVSSRHYPILSLDNNPTVYVEERNANDIEQYVSDRLKSVQSLSQRESFKEGILEKAEGGFQWVLLVTDMMLGGHLNGVKLERLRDQLASCPGSLSQLYGAMLDGVDAAERSQMLKLFDWVLFAEQPLSVQELRDALATDADMIHESVSQMRQHDSWSDTLDAFERHVKRLSRGLVEFQVRNNQTMSTGWRIMYDQCDTTIREAHLIHQSVADFLLATHRNHESSLGLRAFPSTAARGHFRISRSCLKYLNLNEVLDSERLTKEQIASKFPLAVYAVRFSLLHIRKVELEGMDQDDLPSAIQWHYGDHEVMRRKEILWKTLDQNNFWTPRGWPFVRASILHVLVACGSRTACLHILDTNIDEANYVDADGNTPLMFAIWQGYEDVVLIFVDLLLRQSLLSNGPEAQAMIEKIFLKAGISGMNEVLRMILEFAGFGTETAKSSIGSEKPDIESESLVLHPNNAELVSKRPISGGELSTDCLTKALLLTTKYGHNVAVELLLRIDKIDIRKLSLDGDRQTPLHIAAQAGHVDVVASLLKAGAKTSVVTKEGLTPLIVATFRGHREVVKLLLENGVPVDDEGGDFATALGAAVYKGENEIIQLLLAHGADINKQVTRYGSILGVAVWEEMDETVDLLLRKGADVHIEGGNFVIPLGVAAFTGNKQMVRRLLDAGVNGHAKGNSSADSLGGSEDVFDLPMERGADTHQGGREYALALGIAARHGKYEIVELLLDMGADTSVASYPNGRVALHLAAYEGQVQIVQLLLERNADPNAKTHAGKTPLMEASRSGHVATVELLLNKGATLDDMDEDGSTSLSFAARCGHTETVSVLLERNAEMNPCHAGWAPLHFAAYGGHCAVVELLLEKGADLTASTIELASNIVADTASEFLPSDSKFTPLSAAVWSRHGTIVELLLARSVDPSFAVDGWTALYFAAQIGYTSIVVLLLEAGASMDVVAGNGYTPLGVAAWMGHLAVVELLLQGGAHLVLCGENNVYGSPANALAFKGRTDILRLLVKYRFVDLCQIHPGQMTPLQCAALGGHLETLQYVSNQYCNPNSFDSENESPLSEIPNEIFEHGLRTSVSPSPWSALHWACRIGSVEIVETLLARSWQSETVSVPEMHGDWTPFAIAVFHGQKKMLQGLSPSNQAALGFDPDNIYNEGDDHGTFFCDGCFHDIYGPRFRCCVCLDFDYCFMCKFVSEHLHKDHGWKRLEPVHPDDAPECDSE